MKRIIVRILLIFIALILISAIIMYFKFIQDKPVQAFFIACYAGILLINLIAIVFLVNKNFKDKGKP